jgi:hypothetical protein
MSRIHRQASEVENGTAHGALGRTALVSALAAIIVLACAASAFAVSGTPIKIARPQTYGPPSVAVDASGTAYIVWDNTKGLGGIEDVVEYCVVPAGATACAHTGQLTLGAGPGIIFGHVKALVDGSTVLIFAGELAVKGEDYEPTQEWQSTDGGATWTQVLAGKSVAKPPDRGDEQAVVVPGTEELGFGSINLGGGAPLVGQAAFELFPLNPTQECSPHSCPAEESNIPLQTQHARELENEGQFEDAYASIPSGPAAGILGIYMVSSSQTECSGQGFYNQLAFVFGEGLQSAKNSYAVAPEEKAHSAWKTELTHADCEVSNPAVAGGPSGFGVVENDLTRGYTVYHAFDRADDKFDTPLTTITTEKESNPSLSQDGSGNLYLTYASFEGVKLAFSSDGGAAWTGPSYLTTGIGLYGEPTSSVGADGQGWLAWDHEESVYAQQFVASDATPPPPAPPPPPPPPPPPAVASLTIPTQTDDVTSKGGLSVVVDCTGAPCTGSLDLLAKVKETTGKGKKKKTKTVVETIGTASFTSLALGTDTVTAHLNGKGLKLLAHDGYKLSATGSATYLSGGVFKTTTGDVTLKGHKPKKKKK